MSSTVWGHLRQKVARHQHGSAPVGERPQEPPQPVDALWVEAVGRLVEDQDLRLAQERAGQAEALTHPERESLDAAFSGISEVDLVEHLLDAIVSQAGRDGEHPKVVASSSAGMEAVGFEHCTDMAQR
jgi:hypothetical protein